MSEAEKVVAYEDAPDFSLEERIAVGEEIFKYCYQYAPEYVEEFPFPIFPKKSGTQ